MTKFEQVLTSCVDKLKETMKENDKLKVLESLTMYVFMHQHHHHCHNYHYRRSYSGALLGHKEELVAEDEFHDKQVAHGTEGPKPPPKRIPPPQGSLHTM